MFDVFSEEIELQVKSGISNLYWFKSDLKKAWLRSGVKQEICDNLFSKKDFQGRLMTKRQLMDSLYEKLREADYNTRLETSRNFVRILLEQRVFEPVNPEHRIEVSKNCAIRLREILEQQKKDKEYRERIKQKAQEAKQEDYYSQLLKLRERFVESYKLIGQKRGYALEKIFPQLMKISGIPVEESFKIVGEQIDGAIKYDARYYLVELKWIEDKANQSDISSLYMKVEGKMQSLGLYIAMNGYSSELLTSLTKGKNITVILLDGRHIANVISGIYTFQELLEHAIRQACLKGEVYCSHDISPG